MAGNKILVIDGDHASRNYLASTLQKKGYEILQAASGREGLIAAWRDQPALIIADPVMADLPGEELVLRLRSDERTARLSLIALSSDSKPARQHSCLNAGFNDYVVKGPQAIAALLHLVDERLQPRVRKQKEGALLIVFLSAKGGTGTSCLCANIAMNMAQHQPEARVAVADLVLPIGSIAGIVGYAGDQNLVTIARMPAEETNPDFFRRSLTMLDLWQFHLVAGSPDPAHGNELNVERIADIVWALKASHDLVLIDLGRSLSRISLPLIEEADLVVIILGTDLSMVTLTKTVWDFLKSKGVQAPSVYLILNRAVGLEGLTKAEAEKTIGLPIQTAIPYLGGNFSLANNQHQPYTLKFPTDTAAIVLKDTAQQMASLARRLRPG